MAVIFSELFCCNSKLKVAKVNAYKTSVDLYCELLDTLSYSTYFETGAFLKYNLPSMIAVFKLISSTTPLSNIL